MADIAITITTPAKYLQSEDVVIEPPRLSTITSPQLGIKEEWLITVRRVVSA